MEDVRTAEFKASDLFDIKKGKRLTKADMLPGDIAFIGSSAANNGVTARVGNTEHLHPANTFTVSYNGSVGEVFLQEEPFWASDDVNVWYPLFVFSREAVQYIMAVVKKLSARYSYTSKWTIDRMQEETISLPVHPSPDPDHAYTPDDIDWGCMERYIAELEAERIAELEAYLAATGLDDCALTPADEAALACEPPMAEFRVGDVFGLAKHEKYHSPNNLVVDPAGYPYICASNLNNGINKDMSRVIGDNLSLTPEKIIAWGKQCPKFCIHDEQCVTSQGMYYLDMTGYSDRVCQYVCAALSRACDGRYSYSKCLIGKVMDEENISLPVHPSPDPNHVYTPDDIDWDCMERYIRAVEKQVMADVVAYKDEVIATTRRIVGSGPA